MQSVKGTRFVGDNSDSFEIILYSVYSNEELTTIMLEHSKVNLSNAWSATFDFDGYYDDASATYIDYLYDVVTEWVEIVENR